MSRRLVVQLDDVQWADETLLDLIEQLVMLIRDASVLVLCLSRPELLERRIAWGRVQNATILQLEPLAAESASALIDGLPGGSALPASLRGRILTAADGNPLYIEEMLGMLTDNGRLRLADGAWQASDGLAELQLPPTISALIAARLDQLPSTQRQLAERASVAGQSFEQAAVSELVAETARSSLISDLLGLVRRELISPDRSELSAGDAYRFRHLLIRDAAYQALPKADRAELHARFAGWLERVSGDRLTEYEEIVGYHLEQAHLYRAELGLLDETTAALGRRAAILLTAAGRRAIFSRGSVAALGLLERGFALRHSRDLEWVENAARLAGARYSKGLKAEAQALIDEALDWARASGSDVGQAIAEVTRAHYMEQVPTRDDMPRMERAAQILTDAKQHRDAAYAHYVLQMISGNEGRWREAVTHADAVVEQARLSGDYHFYAGAEGQRALAYTAGPWPSFELIARFESLLGELSSSREGQRNLLLCLVDLYGHVGRFDAARQAADAARSTELELGSEIDAAGISQASGPMEQLAGDLQSAEAQLRRDFSTLGALGERRMQSTTAALLADVLCDRGALGEAVAATEQAESLADPTDYLTGVLWRSARARALAGSQPAAALALGEDAVSLATSTDDLVRQGIAFLSVADVHASAGRKSDADDALARAIDAFKAKGAAAYVARAERRPGQAENPPPVPK